MFGLAVLAGGTEYLRHRIIFEPLSLGYLSTFISASCREEDQSKGSWQASHQVSMFRQEQDLSGEGVLTVLEPKVIVNRCGQLHRALFGMGTALVAASRNICADT